MLYCQTIYNLFRMGPGNMTLNTAIISPCNASVGVTLFWKLGVTPVGLLDAEKKLKLFFSMY